eukprot:196930_1
MLDQSVENSNNIISNLKELLQNEILDRSTLALIKNELIAFFGCLDETVNLLGRDTQTWYHKVSEVYSVGNTADNFLNNQTKLVKLLKDISLLSKTLSIEYSNYAKKYYDVEGQLTKLQTMIYVDVDGDLDKMVTVFENIIKERGINDERINNELNELKILMNVQTEQAIKKKMSKIDNLCDDVQHKLRQVMDEAQRNADEWHKKMQLSAISFVIPFVGIGVTTGFGIKYEHEKSVYNNARENFNKVVASEIKQKNQNTAVDHIIKSTSHLNQFAQFLTDMSFFFNAQGTTLQHFGIYDEKKVDEFEQRW